MGGQKPASVTALYTLSSAATHEAVHLLCEMLRLDPDKRIGVVEALNHPYLDEGRLRYHSCMCACCTNNGSSKLEPTNRKRSRLYRKYERCFRFRRKCSRKRKWA